MKSLSILFSCCIVFICPLYWLIGRSAKFVTYQFQVVDMEEPNAFALPGGYVYVSRGLLILVNAEDELAGVIGHEIGHVATRHSVQRLTRAAPIGLVTGVTSAAVGIVSSSLANAVS
jgi:predicted Zn-dependent protease